MDYQDLYPTDEELETIEKWDIVEKGVRELISYIKAIWWSPNWGFRFRGGYLSPSTGGWSGNESIMRALKNNLLFWTMYWRTSRRGGHYTFRIKKDIK